MAAGEYSRALAHFESALLEARLQSDDRRVALALAHRGKLRRHLGLPGGVGDCAWRWSGSGRSRLRTGC